MAVTRMVGLVDDGYIQHMPLLLVAQRVSGTDGSALTYLGLLALAMREGIGKRLGPGVICGIGFRIADIIVSRLGIRPTAMIRVWPGVPFSLTDTIGGMGADMLEGELCVFLAGPALCLHAGGPLSLCCLEFVLQFARLPDPLRGRGSAGLLQAVLALKI
ncbi:MAG: hypothetical protein DI601_08800 [Azospirillum brasilense]|nr:MAG: hypothetical protein DI601_08800 [Azospirillum brasilense]